MKAKEEKILKIIKDFSKKLPKFKDGRINYSNSDIAPVITVFIKYDIHPTAGAVGHPVVGKEKIFNSGFHPRPPEERGIPALPNKDKILLLKRSKKVLTYEGKWNSVAGYLDELKPIQEKVVEEIEEELGIKKNKISSIFLGESYEFKDNEIKKTWIVLPVLVELKNEPEIKLDREHTEYKWIEPEELENFDIVPNLIKSLKRVVKPR